MTTKTIRKGLLLVAVVVSAATGCATAPVQVVSALPRPSVAERRQCVAAAADLCYGRSQDERSIDECMGARVSACESGGPLLVASASRPQ